MNGDTLELITNSLWPLLKATVTSTIPLTLITFVLGLVLALAVALMRLSSVPAVSWLARAYVSVIRGTPLLLQLFIIYYGLPSLGVTFDPFPAAVIAFTLNVGGYAAEAIRGAILSVPKGQWEAASTVGMNYATTLRRVPGAPYDVVFLDPPYPLDETAVAADLAALVEHDWLVPGAMVVVERSARSPEPGWPAGLGEVRSKRYGETTLWYAIASTP